MSRNLSRVAFLLVIAAVLLTSCADPKRSGAIIEKSPSDSPTATFLPEAVQSTAYTVGAAWQFDPPPDGFQPIISSIKAIEIALSEYPDAPVNSTSIQAVLATFTDLKHRDDATAEVSGSGSLTWVKVSVWAVRLDGYGFCLAGGPQLSPPSAPPSCAAGETSMVLVDATTGEWIEKVTWGPDVKIVTNP